MRGTKLLLIALLACVLVAIVVASVDLLTPPIGPAPQLTNITKNVLATGDTNGEVILWEFVNGAFTKTANFSFLSGFFNESCHIENIRIGDVNNDGLDELVITISGCSTWDSRLMGQVVVCALNHSEIIPIWNQTFYPPAWPMSVCIGDVDNDGKDNNFAICNITHLIIYKYQLGNYEVTSAIALIKVGEEPVGKGYHVLGIGDSDNDGLNEVLVSKISTIKIFRLYGSLTMIGMFSVNSTCDNVRIDDVDSDGKNEMLAGGFFHYLSLFRGTNNSYTNIWNSEPAGTEYGYIYQACAIGDINNDGKKEIVGFLNADLNNKGRTMAWQWNDTNFVAILNIAHEDKIMGMYPGGIGDCNNDSKIEWSVEVGGSRIMVYRCIGGNFEKLWEYEDPNFHSSGVMISEIGVIHYLG